MSQKMSNALRQGDKARELGVSKNALILMTLHQEMEEKKCKN